MLNLMFGPRPLCTLQTGTVRVCGPWVPGAVRKVMEPCPVVFCPQLCRHAQVVSQGSAWECAPDQRAEPLHSTVPPLP